MAEAISDQYTKVTWLLQHQHLWRKPEECARAMLAAKLYGKQTKFKHALKNVRNWIELARQVKVGEVDIETLRGKGHPPSFI